MFFNREETFRSILLKTGELRSLVFPTVHLMALTATATSSLRKKFISVFGMRNPIITYLSACCSNIVYSVQPFKFISETFGPLLKAIEVMRVGLPHVILLKVSRLCQFYMHFFKCGLGCFLLNHVMHQILLSFEWWMCLPAIQMS